MPIGKSVCRAWYTGAWEEGKVIRLEMVMLRASPGSLNSSVSDCCSGSLTRITNPSKWPDTVLQDKLRSCGLTDEAVMGPNCGTSSEQRKNSAFQLCCADKSQCGWYMQCQKMHVVVIPVVATSNRGCVFWPPALAYSFML